MKYTQRATSILIVKSKEWAVSVELTYSLFSFGTVERILHNIYPNSKIRTEKFQKFCQDCLQTFHGTVQNFCDKKVLLEIENLPIIRILSCFKKRKKTFKKVQLNLILQTKISVSVLQLFSLRSKMNLSWINW